MRIICMELEARGFEVTVYEPEGFEVMEDSVESFKSRYDLIFYVGNIETASNKTVSRLNWHTMFGLGNNMPWMVHEMPALFCQRRKSVSFAGCADDQNICQRYCNSEYVIHAEVEKLCGDSEFKGKSRSIHSAENRI